MLVSFFSSPELSLRESFFVQLMFESSCQAAYQAAVCLCLSSNAGFCFCKEIGVVETYFPGNFSRAASQSRTSLTERSDRFSMLSVQPEGPSASHTMRDVLPPLLVIFVCIIAAFLGFVVAGLHDMIKYVGCPLGVNGCNSFSGEAYEKKGYILPRALTDLPEDLIYIVAGMFCLFIIGLIVDLAPDNYGKQVLGGGTVQSLLAVAAGIPIPFKCAVLRVVITAIYFVGGGTMGGDGPTIQVCTSLSCMIGWVCALFAIWLGLALPP